MQRESMTIVVEDVLKALDWFGLRFLQAQILSAIEVEVTMNETEELL